MRHHFAVVAGRRLLLYPTYVQDYLDRVTAADVAAGNTSGLELGVTDAANTFIQDLVSDNILGVSGGVISQAASVIKASVPMAGARTRLGAMVPLVGPAPTSFNFVDADYDRKTGLVGNGSSKYLDSNRNSNADPQDNFHLSVYQSSIATATSILCGSNSTTSNTSTLLFAQPSGTNITGRSRSTTSRSISALSAPSLVGQSRASSSSWVLRGSGTSGTITETSAAGANLLPLFVYAQNINGTVSAHSNARIAFYSIGEAIDYSIGEAFDLALLDARVTALINAYAAVIP